MVSVSGMSVHTVQSTRKEDIMTRSSIVALALVAGLGLAVLAPLVSAEMPGVTATEIKIGHTNPYSGPASAYGTIGKAIAAYFKKVNDEGGINGRKIDFITYDDGYSPPKIVEMVRRLVEQDQVAFVFQTLGTANNSAIQKYLNQRSEEHTSELQSLAYLVCRLLLEKKKKRVKGQPQESRASNNCCSRAQY